MTATAKIMKRSTMQEVLEAYGLIEGIAFQPAWADALDHLREHAQTLKEFLTPPAAEDEGGAIHG